MALSYSTGLVHSLFSPTGQGFGECLSGFVVDIYSNAVTRPTSADAAVPAGSVLLGTITKGGVADDGDPLVYGLHFGEPALRAIDKLATETWQFTAKVAGVASWFRLRLPADTGAASTTVFRIDGSIGTFSADARLSSTDIVIDNVYTLNRFKITWPV
jgi:hypothetical protein